MVKSILSLAALALSVLPSLTLAAPAQNGPKGSHGPKGHGGSHFPVVDKWLENKCPGKYNQAPCNEKTIRVRQDFDKMAPLDRKAYTDAINCLRTKPSQLDQTLYPAATDRFMDYAVVHVNQTKVVHLDGFFLTWHRYFLWLFEQDLEAQCGYTGAFPYWNWPATADNLKGSPIFDGSEYSMSGDGLYTNSSPVVLSPSFSIPHGSGGGCVTDGPFANMSVPMANIPSSVIVQGLPLPPTAFNLRPNCLTRDLNTYAAQTWCNYDALYSALDAPTIANFSTQVNGVPGGGSLGLHSGAHFTMGAPASSLFVSPQDPIWYPLHTFLDHLYTSWQIRHPDLANAVYGTQTALNLPPSANMTLDTIEPNWGYFQPGPIAVGELMSTTAGPFCYKYDVAL